MTWKLFLDDVRNVEWVYPDQDARQYQVCRSFQEAVALCEKRGCPDFISFDHDLGENTATGMDFAHWLVQRDLTSEFMPADFQWKVHSANPIGAVNIQALLAGYVLHKHNKDSKL